MLSNLKRRVQVLASSTSVVRAAAASAVAVVASSVMAAPPAIGEVELPVDIASVAGQALNVIGLVLIAMIPIGLGVAASWGLYRKGKGIAGGRG